MFRKLKEKFKSKFLVVTGMVSSALSMMAIPSFAADPEGALNSVAITSDMLQPLLDGITANIGVILPVGVAVFAVFLGVSVLPKLVRKFTSA